MVFMILCTIVFATIVIGYWLSCSPLKWKGKGIDWMIPWPFFGNTAGTLTSSYFDYWLEFSKRAKGKKMIGFHFFTEPALFINDPELIKQILIVEADNFTERIFYIRKGDVFKKNLFGTFGEEWKGYRTKMNPFFSPSRVKSMITIIEKLIVLYTERLEIEAKKGPVEVDHISVLLSIDTIVTCIFGLEPECFKNPKSFFIELQAELPGFLFGLRNLIGVLSPKLYNALGLSAFTKYSTNGITHIVKQIVEARTKGIGVRQDFMQGMVELYNNEIISKETMELNSDGTPFARFDMNGVIAQGMIMFLAGTDTTAHALSFLLYELAKNQKIQDKLRKEIQLAKTNNNGYIGYEEVQEMIYLDMCVKEILRLHSVAPFIPRRCAKGTTLGDIKIEKDIITVIAINAFHRNPKYFPNPDVFNPENFKPGKKIEVGTYFPFGIGPRICIGMRLAEVEIKLAICSVLMKFRILCCQDTPKKAKYAYGPLVGPLGGLTLHLQQL